MEDPKKKVFEKGFSQFKCSPLPKCGEGIPQVIHMKIDQMWSSVFVVITILFGRDWSARGGGHRQHGCVVDSDISGDLIDGPTVDSCVELWKYLFR